MIVVMEFTGDESDGDLERLAWEMFCNAHPIEAYAHDPKGFLSYMRAQHPGIGSDRVERIIKEMEP